MFKFFYYPNFIFNWIQKKSNKQTNETNCGDHRTVYFKRFSLFILFTWNIFVRSNGFQKKKSTKSHCNISQVVSNVFFIEASLSLFIIGTRVMTLIVENSSQELVDWKSAIKAPQWMRWNECTLKNNALQAIRFKNCLFIKEENVNIT